MYLNIINFIIIFDLKTIKTKISILINNYCFKKEKPYAFFKLLILKLLAVQTRLKKSLKIFNNNFKKVANNITIFK